MYLGIPQIMIGEAKLRRMQILKLLLRLHAYCYRLNSFISKIVELVTFYDFQFFI